MSNQNSSGDDGSRHDGSRTDNVDVGSREHPEQLSHIHDAFEGIGQGGNVGNNKHPQELNRIHDAFENMLGGNEDSLPEEGEEEHLQELVHFPDAPEDMEHFFDEFVREDFVDAATAGAFGPDLLQLLDEALASPVNNDTGNCEESGSDGNNEHLGQRVHLRESLEDMQQSFDGFWREDLGLCASVEHQGGTRGGLGPDLLQLHDALEQEGLRFDDLTRTEQQGTNVDFLSEEDHAAKSEWQDFTLSTSADQQSVKFLPEEDDVATRRRLELDPVQPAVEVLANHFRHAGMSVPEVEVVEMVKQGRKGGIAPNPNTLLETKVHTERMKKKRRFGIKYKKKKKSEPSQEAQEVCQSTVCCDRRWNCVSLFVFFSHRISLSRQRNAGKMAMVKEGAEVVPPLAT
jgi:hypothetical protein